MSTTLATRAARELQKLPPAEAAWRALLHPLLRAPLRRDVLAVIAERSGLVPTQIVDVLSEGSQHRASYDLVWNAIHELAKGRLVELRSGTALAPAAYVTRLGRHCQYFSEQVAR